MLLPLHDSGVLKPKAFALRSLQMASLDEPCSAASSSSGRSTIIMWPAPRNTMVREFASAAASARRPCRSHHVAFAKDHGGRDRDLCGRRQRALIGVARSEIVEQHAGPAMFQHALGAAMHPQSRREAAAQLRPKPSPQIETMSTAS